ncbi:MAG: hypothetical protein HC899_33315 [Leptolyngbyaceae cyanobacterium SM1_4_3]|nr:hypothetical protein [Leptolyngbyaceae cyanobacterium SM1_4_3]
MDSKLVVNDTKKSPSQSTTPEFLRQNPCRRCVLPLACLHSPVVAVLEDYL